ncbi:hypothetical protein M8C21_003044, partial [Ambrosia artemisiifolia]
TPNHPPYAAMIYKAICELNKKGGSSEKLISEYIQKEYADLPWAHSTLLKHHLEKLCDRKEICMTDKQCYLLAAADSESEKTNSRTSKKCKKQNSRSNSEAGKTSSRPHKKYKKKKKNQLGIQKTSGKEQIGLRKRKRKQGLKSKRKRVKKRSINEDTKLQLLGEPNLKQNNEVPVDESHGQKQSFEVQTGDIQIQEQNGLYKRKPGRKPKRKSSKRTKKDVINEDNKLQLLGEANLEQNNEVTDDVSHEQNQIVEVNRGDIHQEQNEAGHVSDHDNSGYINLEQAQMKKNSELPQPEESPYSKPTLHRNGKRVWTRSQLKTVSKNDALAASSELTDSLSDANTPKDKLVIVEHLSNEKHQAMEIINVKSTVDNEPQQLSGSPSLDEPLVEFIKPMPLELIPWFPDDEPTAAPSSTEMQDATSSQQDQQTEKLPLDDKATYKRRGRHAKPTEPDKSKVQSQQSDNKLIPRFSDDEPNAAPSSTAVQDATCSQQDQQPEMLPLDDKPKYKRLGRHLKSMEPEKPKVESQQSAKKLIPGVPNEELTAAPSSREGQDIISSQQDQQTEKLPLDDKPKHKRRGRPPKSMEPEKLKFKSQQLAKKCKAGKKKGQPKYKGFGRHKMTRRSSRKPSEVFAHARIS